MGKPDKPAKARGGEPTRVGGEAEVLTSAVAAAGLLFWCRTGEACEPEDVEADKAVSTAGIQGGEQGTRIVTAGI